YIFLRLDLDPAPLLLGFILGPMLEENFRRALLISRGSFNIFVTRPISATLLAIIAAFVALLGRVTKMLKLPRLMRSARRKFSSSIGPRMNPSSSGAGSRSRRRKM